MTTLKAPFPYFGGKSRAAHLIWPRFGDVNNYVEPFFGSGAILLARPHYNRHARAFRGKSWRTETVNDADAYLANFWRAIQPETGDPAAVAHHANWPVNENDLHARHNWLVNSTSAAEFRQRMSSDPEYFDAKFAGWWAWGKSAWIGQGWCSSSSCQIPHIGDSGRGVAAPTAGALHAKRPNLPQGGGRGTSAPPQNMMPIHGNCGGNLRNAVYQSRPQLRPGQGVNDRRQQLEAWMHALADRLRNVRVCCGDWSRICTPSPTYKIGLTAILLDPPYSAEEKRAANLYAKDSLTVAADVRRWLFEKIDDPKNNFSGARYRHPLLRIAYCGYEGLEFPSDWTCIAWKANGGYGNQKRDGSNQNASRERIWFSPNCLNPATKRSLFDAMELAQ